MPECGAAAMRGAAACWALLIGPALAHAGREAVPTGAGSPAAAVAAPVAPAVPRSYPARAVADYARAVQLAQDGNTTEAELEFGQLSAAYPDLAGPQINIGLLRRRAGDLSAAEAALRLATERNSGSAIAWSELALTLRMRGQFEQAATAYERAIAADPAYAPAHRNLGVLLDLYLDRPAPALAALERYRELVGEDKQLNGWIAELRQRVARLAPSQGDAGPAPAQQPGDATQVPENAP
jgi:tetratricopeptide (TPR) repeat protein